jgi:hypothetical protein
MAAAVVAATVAVDLAAEAEAEGAEILTRPNSSNG